MEEKKNTAVGEILVARERHARQTGAA